MLIKKKRLKHQFFLIVYWKKVVSLRQKILKTFQNEKSNFFGWAYHRPCTYRLW